MTMTTTAGVSRTGLGELQHLYAEGHLIQAVPREEMA